MYDTIIVFTSKMGIPLLGFQIDSDNNVATIDDKKLRLNNDATYLTTTITSILYQLSNLINPDSIEKPSEIIIFVSESRDLLAFTITNKTDDSSLIGQYLLNEIPSNESDPRDAADFIRQLIIETISAGSTQKSKIEKILFDMETELTRYVSFIVAFELSNNKLICSTLQSRKDNLLAEEVFNELIKKGQLTIESTTISEIKNRSLGDLQTFFFIAYGIAYVIYSASIQINTGIIRLKLATWLKNNSNRFLLINEAADNEQIKSKQISLISENNSIAQMKIKISKN